MTAITIDARYCGPPTTGNGGYCAGSVAELIDGPARVTLRAPPPLDKALRIERGDVVRAFDGEQLVLEAAPEPLELDVPAPPSWADAEQMAAAYAGFEEHIFPTCFTCGPEREEGDGLRIFAGRLASEGMVAAPWRPGSSLAVDGVVRSPIVWAALDCPGYFAIATGEMAMLGRMHADVDGTVRQDERYIVIGWPVSRQGRKLHAGTAVFSADDGRCMGRALQTWVVVTPP